MTVKDIIIEYLKKNGYHGLMAENINCGCDITSFLHCDIFYYCKPAYKVECNDKSKKLCGEEYCMSEKKNSKCEYNEDYGN